MNAGLKNVFGVIFVVETNHVFTVFRSSGRYSPRGRIGGLFWRRLTTLSKHHAPAPALTWGQRGRGSRVVACGPRGRPYRRGIAAAPSSSGGTSASTEVAEDDAEANMKAATLTANFVVFVGNRFKLGPRLAFKYFDDVVVYRFFFQLVVDLGGIIDSDAGAYIKGRPGRPWTPLVSDCKWSGIGLSDRTNSGKKNPLFVRFQKIGQTEEK